ncbi:DUF896 domain-containing protein [Sarcina sp. JB2]|uniref:DUF896 domain-containing protein n=1 Tax=Candidatus Sarcina troglodytae TaxID=2726954 RepID=A0ACD1BDR0_9CLOT|nr:DUF896 domain-containing protein [Sarcina sp. JB2]QPJ85527.1 DUF896 domain-containing protein [Sarcina sp. JB2]
MNIDELVSRINELSKKSKEIGLTDEEKKEQQVLRRDYIDRFKNNLRAQLETIKINNKKDSIIIKK